MDFRIRQLESFLTLAELLHYGRTARALYMSQPTMTSQIKSLEESFGTQLFERDRRGVRLTGAGQALRVYAQTIVDTVDAAKAKLEEMSGRQSLRISCGPWGQTDLLPAVLRELAVSQPGFELEVRELTTEEKMAELRGGAVDMLLMVGRLPVEGARFEEICRRPLVAMVSRQSMWARKRSLSVEELRGVPLIVPRLRDCSQGQGFLRELLEPYGIEPKIVEVPQSCAVQLAYVAADEGIVVGAKCGALERNAGVVAIPFRESLPEVALGLMSMEGQETAALASFRRVVWGCVSAAAMRIAARVATEMMPAGEVAGGQSW